VETLYAPGTSLSEDGRDGGVGSGEEDEDEGEGEDGEILWAACSEAMQNHPGQLVLLIRCDQVYSTGLSLLGRLVGCVANAHIAAQVLHSSRGQVSVVLRGWADDKIEAEWSDEEPDEFCISPLR